MMMGTNKYTQTCCAASHVDACDEEETVREAEENSDSSRAVRKIM